MSHAERLRLRLLAILGLVNAACDAAPTTNDGAPAATTQPDAQPKPELKSEAKPEPQPTPQPEPIAKTTLDPDLLPPPEPQLVDPQPEPQPRPTCPSGTWCGLVRPPVTGPDTAMGCPAQAGVEVKPLASHGLAPQPSSHTSFDPTLTKTTRDAGEADACCYQWVVPCPGGRPLVDGTRVVSAILGVADAPLATAFRPPHPWAAAAWMRDAADEYASVASFARAAIELMAVGAPATLVEACHDAALDEIVHARVCTEIAWSLGAQHETPTRVPAVAPRPPSLARVAADTFVEGCVGETLAALAIRTAAARCEDATLRTTLEAIAADEERHAALAWRTVAWATSVGGVDVVTAVRSAAAATQPSSGDAIDVSREPGDAELARCGRLDAAMRAQIVRCGWREVIDPLLRALLHAEVYA